MTRKDVPTFIEGFGSVIDFRGSVRKPAARKHNAGKEPKVKPSENALVILGVGCTIFILLVLVSYVGVLLLCRLIPC